MWLQQMHVWWPRLKLSEMGQPVMSSLQRCLCKRDRPGGSLPAGETCLFLCKQNLPLDFGRNKKAMYEKFPFHAEVRLAMYAQQSWETRMQLFQLREIYCVCWCLLLQRQDWVWVDVLLAGWRKPIPSNDQSFPVTGDLYVAFTMKQI